MVLVLLLLSGLSVAAAATHIDYLRPENCVQGDVVEVTAQLWIKGNYWDELLGSEYLDFKVCNDNGTVYSRTKITNFLQQKQAFI